MSEPLEQQKPRHIGVIMDGNGRWAQQRGLKRTAGHSEGIESVKAILQAAREHKINYLTLYAFSVENWNRPQAEVDLLMEILASFMESQAPELHKHKIRLHTIGDISAFPSTIFEHIQELKAATAHYTDYNLCIALNYGSRDEVLNAISRYSASHKPGSKPSWEEFAEYLDTSYIPDPDLIIRTSGEHRLSNFLLLQAAYAELYFTEILWPDFREKEFVQALQAYAKRERRFGKTSEQIRSQ